MESMIAIGGLLVLFLAVRSRGNGRPRGATRVAPGAGVRVSPPASGQAQVPSYEGYDAPTFLRNRRELHDQLREALARDGRGGGASREPAEEKR